MTDNDLLNKFIRYVGQTSGFPPGVIVQRAEGNTIYDTQGRRYLDFISGIAVTNVGHCHPRVVQAVTQQAQQYAHTMVYGEHVQEVQVRLAEKIVSVAPVNLESVYFLTTGAEANDAAMKLAVKHTGRRRFVAFHAAYHGDTAGALSCFGSDVYRRQFPGMLAEVTFLPFGDAEALSGIDETVAAVLIEPVQGEGGIRVPSAQYLKAVRQRCDEAGALLIFDEVQTGFGRLGEWFAANHFGVQPDVMTLAKGMGAGYPLAGVLAPRQMLYDFAAVPDFSHITTFGGHPVSCAAGLAGMEIIEEDNLLENAREQGRWLVQALGELQQGTDSAERVVAVRGLGLMIGLEMADDASARRVVDGCRQRGLILETNLLRESVVRLSPALTVTRSECEQAVDILTETIKGRA